ncbi:H+/Cl-antiporter ClcA [Flexibacter flexilis DSM 6793]|uniref:H+/Cl-antiporter ClcA n=1 Tax=Flexibacter flexilis DSM 6793 TaxID=927664 RepID=A0A1I1EBQ0_9BACT|nr:chloride channel protein [Flexibacter flexilis]SFB82363.1 H+/Cl-antiporter ClcA [Flexibacter flexilis DSM 6793]
MTQTQTQLSYKQPLNQLAWFGLWAGLGLLLGLIVGSACAIFLISLQWVTQWRESHVWIIGLLPLLAAAVAYLYQRFDTGEESKGNNTIISRIQHPEQKPISWRMSPMVLVGTLLTHLGGGSAGREGTAVQIGGALASLLLKFGRWSKENQILLLMCGAGAGFSALFGTPLAGAIFAIEFAVVGKMWHKAWLPVFWASLCANYVCNLWPVTHTHYPQITMPTFSPENLLYVVVAAIAFGLAARVFVWLNEWLSAKSKQFISNAILRAAIGGAIVAASVWLAGTTQYIGLGLPLIEASFREPQAIYIFFIKIVLTCLTLSFGMKGGEVTPLFFIGATLGSALAVWLPLPVAGLAGMGLIAVFSASANVPLTGLLLGVELFGAQAGLYWALATWLACWVSGKKGIYTTQQLF